MKGLHKRGQVWWISYQVGRKQVRESTHLSNKRAAEQLLYERRAKVAQGDWEPRTRNLPILRDFTPTFLSWVEKYSTRERYRYSLERVSEYLGDARLNEISVRTVYGYQAKRLSAGISPATINRDIRTLSRLFSRARKRGAFTIGNPCKDFEFLNEVDSRRKSVPFSREEEVQLLAFATGWMRIFLVTLIETGMRPKKEALPLRWEDLELDSEPGTIIVKSSKTRAGQRKIWLTRYCRTLLQQWKQETGPVFSPYIFANPRDPLKHIVDYQGQWKELAKRAGVAGHRLYDTRATFASRTSASSPSTLTVAQLMGHNDISTLRSYVRPLDENTRAILDSLDKARDMFLSIQSKVQ